ncbi:hypothetical protein Ddc_14427 [Ditylenchus destructor]|nr:hypothetical protein Ddc_14427 [Ditylenchus destructor]
MQNTTIEIVLPPDHGVQTPSSIPNWAFFAAVLWIALSRDPPTPPQLSFLLVFLFSSLENGYLHENEHLRNASGYGQNFVNGRGFHSSGPIHSKACLDTAPYLSPAGFSSRPGWRSL